jgi:hypothetical protein
VFIPANREEHVRCAYLKLVWVCFRKPVSLSFMEHEREQVYHEGNTAGEPCAVKVASTVRRREIGDMLVYSNAPISYPTNEVSLKTLR